MPHPPRRICFVTGSRAEFGLMQSTLRAIQKHPKLELQIIATGMHLDPAYGKPLSALLEAGFKATETVHWSPAANSSPSFYTLATGMAVGSMGMFFSKLKPDLVLV